MRALRTCDFCDGEAVGTFEIVPPELEPTETEQRRVVLCSGCRNQLEDLLEPLLARAGVGDTSTTADADETVADPDTDGDSGTVVATANESTQKQARTSSPNATVSESDSDDSNDTGDTDDVDVDSEAGPILEDGISFERSDSAASDDSSDPAGESGAINSADEGGTSESADADRTDRSANETETAASESATRPPKAYGKVVRLLQNREFPVQRNAAENLAAGAYELESHEVEAIIDHALEQGEFVENRDMLERP
ncbi:hypothetical protein [Natronorubrum sp. FCH18a]|uniref:hypothetical protein n=1 Tax=Natronorubrum sp. FCH18a TaxID=3447018 RepID=UPI003F512C7B